MRIDKRLLQSKNEGWMIYFVLVGFLLAPKIGILDLSVLFLIFGFLVFASRLTINRSGSFVIWSFFIISILILISGLVNDNLNYEILLKPVRNILIVYLLYAIFRSRKLTLINIFDAVIFAGLINSTAVLLQFLFTLKGWDDTILRFYPAGETLGGLRKPGLSSGYPSSGMLSCIAAIIAVYLYYFNNNKKYFLLLILCLPGVFLSARTSVVLFCIAFFAIILYAIFNRRIGFLFKFSLVFSLIFSFVAALIASSPKIYEVFYIMFEFVFVYIDNHEIGVRSTDDLLENHYFLPSNFIDWIIGNSKSPWGFNGIPSDVWFVQNLIGSGLFSVILYLASFSCLWFFSTRAASGYQRLIVFLVFLLIFVSSFKGSFIFSRFVGDVATLIGAYSLAKLSMNDSIKRLI